MFFNSFVICKLALLLPFMVMLFPLCVQVYQNSSHAYNERFCLVLQSVVLSNTQQSSIQQIIWSLFSFHIPSVCLPLLIKCKPVILGYVIKDSYFTFSRENVSILCSKLLIYLFSSFNYLIQKEFFLKGAGKNITPNS